MAADNNKQEKPKQPKDHKLIKYRNYNPPSIQTIVAEIRKSLSFMPTTLIDQIIAGYLKTLEICLPSANTISPTEITKMLLGLNLPKDFVYRLPSHYSSEALQKIIGIVKTKISKSAQPLISSQVNTEKVEAKKIVAMYKDVGFFETTRRKLEEQAHIVRVGSSQRNCIFFTLTVVLVALATIQASMSASATPTVRERGLINNLLMLWPVILLLGIPFIYMPGAETIRNQPLELFSTPLAATLNEDFYDPMDEKDFETFGSKPL